jgi:hypothetical protein
MAINHYTPSNALSGSMNPISLRDVLDLRVTIHWTEAVAVVEALCHRLAEDYPDGMHVPEVPDILITSHGTLMIRRGASSDQGLDGLGHTLHALLESAAQTPMPLRLFVTHSVAAGKFGSVQEFAEALSYYAPPDRDGLVTALYVRCLEAPVPALAPPAPIEIAKSEPEPKEDPKQAKRKIPTWVPFAATFVVVLVSGLAVLGLSDSDPHVKSSVASLKGAMASAAAAVRESFGAAPAAEPVEAVAQTVPAEPARRARNRQSLLRSDSTLSRTLVTRYPPDARPGGAANDAAEAAGVGVAEASGSIIEPPIYSSASPGVLPPVMRAPKLPPAPPPAQASERDTNTIELLIDESGQVTQARLLTRPMRMPDMMLLSGAKAFKFYPAVKDGKPVKYRLSLNWVHSSP